jgi:hypothetical protein
MKLGDRMPAVLAAEVASADRTQVIPAGARVVLTFSDDTAVGVHWNGKRVIASLSELIGAELYDEADDD